MLSNFFYSRQDFDQPVSHPDLILTVEKTEDGKNLSVVKDLNTMLDPLSVLSYNDFSVHECLIHGVSYKSLNISPDLRLGFDSEIESFNNRLDQISDKLFNPSKTELL